MKNLYSNEYNSLPDVIVADKELTKMGRDDILNPLLEVIKRHDLQKVVGLRLLHNHNHISTNEIMLEQEEVNNNENCLTTMATKISQVKEGFYPNSWALNDSLIPLEYSPDSSIENDCNLILNNKSFIEDFKCEANKLGVNHLLGLYILKRRFFEECKPNIELDYELIETTDITRRANIVRFKISNDIEEDSLIDTVWAVQTDNITMGCEKTNPRCVKLNCNVVVIRCIEDGYGGHDSKTRHSSTHAKDYEHVFKP